MSITPVGIITSISGADAQGMRDYTIPFAEDLARVAAELGWDTQSATLQVGDETVRLPAGHTPPIASFGHDLIVGLSAALAAGLMDAFANDIYTRLLSEPVRNLWRRLREKAPPSRSVIRIATEILFVDDQLLLRIEVRVDADDEPDVSHLFRTATDVAQTFLRKKGQQRPQHRRNLANPDVLLIRVEPDGSVGEPTLIASNGSESGG